ncbi:MAG TPA: class I SAM-dependent methyltransferase [candidate division Zixibacteria bacterium]|nr:class I SAM-dependent methyltransferase [candidate division Zixibacteria bacterium]
MTTKILTKRAEKKVYFDQYWDTRDLPSADLRSQQRAEIAYEILSQKRGKLLDVGCGRGLNSEFFKNAGFEVEALDVSPQAVQLTKSKGVKAFLFDIEHERIREKYDAILCLEVLQFVVNPTKVLLNLRQALNSKGEIILSLPNEFHLQRRCDILWGKLDFIGAKAPHLRFFNYAEIEKLIEECGLKIMIQREVSVISPARKNWNWLSDLLLQVSPDLFSLAYIFNLRSRAV